MQVQPNYNTQKKKTVMHLKLFAFLCRDGVTVLRRPN